MKDLLNELATLGFYHEIIRQPHVVAVWWDDDDLEGDDLEGDESSNLAIVLGEGECEIIYNEEK